MADTPKPPEIPLQVQIDDAVANGQYVNMALVNHTETEFTLDFIYVQPQQPRARVLSRIITNPKHLKRLLGALQDSLARYEAAPRPHRALRGRAPHALTAPHSLDSRASDGGLRQGGGLPADGK